MSAWDDRVCKFSFDLIVLSWLDEIIVDFAVIVPLQVLIVDNTASLDPLNRGTCAVVVVAATMITSLLQPFSHDSFLTLYRSFEQVGTLS